jgi:CIC family chloride channel protein
MKGESDNAKKATRSTRRHVKVAPIQPIPARPAEDESPEPLPLAWLLILALAVGCITGLGAVAFRDLIGFVHNLLFLGQISFSYDASRFTPASPWGVLVIFVPVVGGLLVTWIVENFAPEAKGHGVPEVMDAIYYKGGIIRPVVALVKSIASAFAIGSGAAVGREGPIIQIGSALGSTFGQFIRMSTGQRITLVAAGAGAGIAATFNTPIGGVLFATELMMPEISVDTFMPVVLATGTATFIGRLFFGAEAAFLVPAQLGAIPNQLSSVFTLALYALLGALTGVAAAALIHALHWAEDTFDRMPNRYLRHAAGMLLVGLLMYALWRGAGHYYVEGVGYASIQATLYGQLQGGAFLLLLAVCKLFATSVSLGSGSSGGVFSPSLFIGAMLGASIASLISAAVPGAPISAPAFAMVGMGAMVGGGTGAAMTAVAMIFEMTRDYDIVLPMIIAVAVSLGVRRLLSAESIYTLKLRRRGHAIPNALHANMFLVQEAGQVMETDALVLDHATPFREILLRSEGMLFRHAVVTKDDRILGVLRINMGLRRAVSQADSDITVGELAQRNFIVVMQHEIAFRVISRLWKQHAAMAVVVEQDDARIPVRVLGVIAKEHVADSVARSIRIFPGKH